MTSAPVPAAAARERPGSGGAWLYGPTIDLLIGAGAGYLLSVPLFLWIGREWAVTGWPVIVGAGFALFLAGPHYGATLLRVYEQRDDRRKYAIFSLGATIVLAALFGVALHHVFVGSLLVTAYASWSPWHFSGQNYGLALLFLRRRGVAIDAFTRRCLHASFFLSFVLSLLVMHGTASTLTFSSVPVSSASVFRFLSLGISRDVLDVAVPLVAAGYACTLAATAFSLLRRARPAELLPSACLVLTQSLWFAVPAALPLLTDAPLQGLAFAVVWISAAHSAQYLWVTSYYDRQQRQSRGDGTRRPAGYWLHALLAGTAVTTLPALVFAPRLLGSVPWDSGLAILVFSVVNLHHFVLDGAIWKLRDGRVARFLLREQPSVRGAQPASPRRPPWGRAVVALLGAVSLVVASLDVFEREIVINRAGGDVDRVVRSARRLAWIGRDAPGLHEQIARARLRQNRPEDAIAEYRRSLALQPTSSAWLGLGVVHASQADWAAAGRAFDAALALDPDDTRALTQRGRVWLELGRPDLARRDLERAKLLDPLDAEIRRVLRRVDDAMPDGS